MKFFHKIPFVKKISGHRQRALRRELERLHPVARSLTNSDDLFMVFAALDGLKERLDRLEARLDSRH